MSNNITRTHEYAVHLIWTGGGYGPARDYASYSRTYTLAFDGKPTLEASADPQFRGNAALHNPEDLLVGALAGCHMLTYLAHCVRAKIAVTAYEDATSGTMTLEGGGGEGGGRFIEVTLRPRVTVAAGTDVAKALTLHEAAHRDCFIAASMNFPVRHDAKIIIAN
jgi:organic hydroperoxide reductase OsmC/OhrA